PHGERPTRPLGLAAVERAGTDGSIHRSTRRPGAGSLHPTRGQMINTNGSCRSAPSSVEDDELSSQAVAPLRLPRMLEPLSIEEASLSELRRLHDELGAQGHFGDIVGISTAMRNVYEAIGRVAPTSEPVLLIGLTGTGKELAAAMIHRLSGRARGPFIALNCGAVSATLIESELFGHERGSFTGADRQRKGVFEQAQGGTLFLDEITEMAPNLQVRLLRVLETGVLTRVGGSIAVRFDVRIVAATNRDPDAAVEAGALREDLLYRLSVFPLWLPSLKERGDDVELLAQHSLLQLNNENGTSQRFSEPALARLRECQWPGNVRELRNVVRRASIMAGEIIDIGDLGLGGPRLAPLMDGSAIVIRPGTSIQDAEKRLIEATLLHVNGDKRSASNLLGISLKTLYTRLGLYAAAR